MSQKHLLQELLGCVQKSFYSYISNFYKNYRYLKELIKITYDFLISHFFAYFNKLHGESYKKKLKTAYTSNFYKNCRYLKELIKITYDFPISHF